ncbi:MAG: DUF2652 domain-containing protein [Chitinophagaceae bacterium]|nr:DUF2652 domain-containing protein [Chitinophagaceae bacterium]
MATQTATQTTVQPALLFMPDISGFTDFVTNTEITHAQNIIQEVLEVIIESNQLNLEVGEIEGDAVFFYRIGNPPDLQQLLQQVQTMFTRFHQHLKLYDHQRICPCGACKSAVDLKLKFIAHFGEVAGYTVKKHSKLFGKDVIVIHRLLKNSLNKKEYALFTEPLVKGAQPAQNTPSWFEPEDAAEQYDVGEIKFKIVDLEKLHQELPPVQPPVINLSQQAKTVFTEERSIAAPMWNVFAAIFDLEQRPKWMEGIKAVEMISKDNINRVGTVHKCIVKEKNNPVIVTEKASIDSDKIELVEMDDKGMGGCRYVVEKAGENASKLKIDMLVKNNPFVGAMFSLFMKNKMKKRIVKSIDNLHRFLQQSQN